MSRNYVAAAQSWNDLTK